MHNQFCEMLLISIIDKTDIFLLKMIYLMYLHINIEFDLYKCNFMKTTFYM